MKQSDIGVIGLAVMGENLVLNMESKGFTVSVFNRTTDKVDTFIKGRAEKKISKVSIICQILLHPWHVRAK